MRLFTWESAWPRWENKARSAMTCLQSNPTYTTRNVTKNSGQFACSSTRIVTITLYWTCIYCNCITASRMFLTSYQISGSKDHKFSKATLTMTGNYWQCFVTLRTLSMQQVAHELSWAQGYQKGTTTRGHRTFRTCAPGVHGDRWCAEPEAQRWKRKKI